MNDYALIKSLDGDFIIGHGPFTEAAECPGQGVAFYMNDFRLSSEKPWKIPQRVERVKSLSEMTTQGVAPECEWSSLDVDAFAEVFTEIHQEIDSGKVEKTVPVVVENGDVQQGAMDELIFHAPKPHHEYYSYGWSYEGEGFCGHTPELLFSYEKGRLHTMALAGTAHVEDIEIFNHDQKEIQEHEFVAQSLVSKLNDIGMVKRENRRVMNLGNIVHFHTPIYVGLYDAFSLDSLLHRLHPTPALGPLPRKDDTMRDLIDWRNRLDCPEHFGAPFGVYDHGKFHAVVAIRCVHWEGSLVKIPAGCGVIEASRLTNEWRELQLKRSSVKRMFFPTE